MIGEWVNQAVCAVWCADPTEFDNDKDGPEARATIRTYCNHCPVIEACAASVAKDFAGIMGGRVWDGRRPVPVHVPDADMLRLHRAYQRGDKSQATHQGELAYQRYRQKKQRDQKRATRADAINLEDVAWLEKLGETLDNIAPRLGVNRDSIIVARSRRRRTAGGDAA